MALFYRWSCSHVFITPSRPLGLFTILKINNVLYLVLILLHKYKTPWFSSTDRWVGAQLFQSWNLKQSLAIFQTGWSLLGVAWAVKRKFWLKKRSLFPSNFTVPPVTTSRVVWPWVACSVKEWIDSCTISPFGLLRKQLKHLKFMFKHLNNFASLTMNRLTIDCVNLEFTRWQWLKKLSQSILSWDGIPIPHQRGLVQVESGQVLRQGRY